MKFGREKDDGDDDVDDDEDGDIYVYEWDDFRCHAEAKTP